LRSRVLRVDFTDYGKSKIASKSKVIVASFVENDQTFKESKRGAEQETNKQIQNYNGNATIQKPTFQFC
jgi:hypothetical protein